ncbi:MAG: hypothetical protein JSR72_16490 [Proteobacteria bacterium]|nr:hypothetical protein [Pseudomonadota bacterium]
MTVLRGLSIVALVLAAAPAVAGETVAGRWGDDVSCGALFFSANAPLTVTDYAVRWQGDSCRVGRMYKTGDTVHIEALCWDMAGERSVPVSLRPHAGKLAVTWDRARRADLKRCK